MWAALAGSWNLLAGYAGAVDLGPVVYHGIGAFVTAALMLKLGLPFLVSAGLAGVMAIAIAYAVGTPTLRLRGAYFAIGTLALAESTKQLALAWDRLTRIPLTGGSAGVSLPLSAGYVPFYYVMLGLMALLGGLGTPFGPIVGAAFLTLVSEFLGTRFVYHYLIAIGVIIVLVSLFAPAGLTGILEVVRRRREATA